MTEAEHLAAIAASPDDDGPRLVYADWLTAQGNPRGELIAIQCGHVDDARASRRENELLQALREAIVAPLLAVLPTGGFRREYKVDVRRGFVDELRAYPDVLGVLDAVYAAAPVLRALRIDNDPALHAGRLQLDSPKLARLRSLDVRLGTGGDPLARSIAKARHLVNLTSLRVSGSMLTMNPLPASLALGFEGVEALAGSPHLTSVRRLDLSLNRVDRGGLEAILAAAWPLEELRLDWNLTLVDAGEIFAASRRAPTIRRLSLVGIQIDAEDAERLAGARCLAGLEALDLERSSINPESLVALLDAMPPTLRELRVEGNRIGDRGALALAEHPRAAQLRLLALGHNRIGNGGALAIAASPQLAGLERLHLNDPRWRPETVAALAQSPTLANATIYLKGKRVATKDRSARTDVRSTPAAPSTSRRRGTRR